MKVSLLFTITILLCCLFCSSAISIDTAPTVSTITLKMTNNSGGNKAFWETEFTKTCTIKKIYKTNGESEPSNWDELPIEGSANQGENHFWTDAEGEFENGEEYAVKVNYTGSTEPEFKSGGHSGFTDTWPS